MDKRYDLEERLVRFAGDCIKYCSTVGNTFGESHLREQLIRSACGACLNYGEAQGVESKKDFIHKNGIVLKELKESRSTLKILAYSELGDLLIRTELLKESEELSAIFGRIITSARKNLSNEQ
ncbi:four helix bundle protein [Algoriphagus sp.]|jgi:four helix bundle protein|uniref:four helix bundle protein n=1 Tax=Algoriphagus sp. TaxID=1872435 RepID=UPI00271AD805|nr:four helix bundle protein [Algoriphagus sp.]MDO8966218.1 four helix bundle protein [Algoriphagus sp.]MDP3198656.1 four helix bundle protein [Algoriphagus sp.]